MSFNELLRVLKGGAGSGHWGHSGIPGRRGGSAPRRGAESVLLDSPTGNKPVGLPISNGLNLVAISKGKHASAIREAVEAIDGVHGDGYLRETPVTLTDSTKVNGVYLHHAELRDINVGVVAVSDEISISRNTKTPMLTTAHEIGHFIDQQGLARGKGWGTDGKSAEMNSLMKSIHNSSAYKGLERANTKGIITTYKDKRGQRRSSTFEADKRYTNYLREPKEVFARAYAQYVAKKSGNLRMLNELNQARQTMTYPQYWSDKDFKPIEKAFDELFTSKGWIK